MYTCLYLGILATVYNICGWRHYLSYFFSYNSLWSVVRFFFPPNVVNKSNSLYTKLATIIHQYILLSISFSRLLSIFFFFFVYILFIYLLVFTFYMCPQITFHNVFYWVAISFHDTLIIISMDVAYNEFGEQ